MAKDLNQCNFIGRLGRDVETRYLPSGVAVANFSIACGDDYKDKNSGEKVEQTNWINIVMFGKPAETAEKYLRKGSRIFVTGKYTVRTYDGNDGKKGYSHEIKADYFQMLDSKGGGQPANSAHQEAKQNGYQKQPDDGFDTDIPFANPYKRIEYLV